MLLITMVRSTGWKRPTKQFLEPVVQPGYPTFVPIVLLEMDICRPNGIYCHPLL